MKLRSAFSTRSEVSLNWKYLNTKNNIQIFYLEELHCGPDKVQAKFFHEMAFLAGFKLFPSSEIDFWSFLKLLKMDFGQKKFS